MELGLVKKLYDPMGTIGTTGTGEIEVANMFEHWQADTEENR